MNTNDTRWRCKACRHISRTDTLLRGKNPFNHDDVIAGCPKCKSVEGFDEICDEPTCTSMASCGFPTAKGYRRTCSAHSNNFRKVK